MEKRTTVATKNQVGVRARSAAKAGPVKAASPKRLATMQKPVTGKGKRESGKVGPASDAKLRTAAFKALSPAALYRSTGLERVQMIREGVAAAALEQIVRNMGIPKDRLYGTLRLPRSTIDRKIRSNDALSAEHSERVIGLERLIGQVEVMVAQSGDPEGFDADRWVGAWLETPLPALGGAKPAEFMDTMEGQELVSRLLAQSQSGAYA